LNFEATALEVTELEATMLEATAIIGHKNTIFLKSLLFY
jgi:hypothetical protein